MRFSSTPIFAACALALTGAAFAQTAPVTKSYSTDFSYTENPISDAGTWSAHNSDWTTVRSNGSIAFGTQTGSGGYDDSLALLSGYPKNQRVSGVIHLAGGRSGATSTHEVELILHGTITPTSISLYECNIGYAGASGWYSQIMKLNGPIGTFVQIDGGGSIPAVKDGDVFMAEIQGSTIRTYLNGTLINTAVDSSIPGGQPGIGFFWRGTEQLTDFAFTSFTAFGTDGSLTATSRPLPPASFSVR